MLTASQVACPNCTQSLNLSRPPAVGKRLHCPHCGCPFTVSARDLRAPTSSAAIAPANNGYQPPPLPIPARPAPHAAPQSPNRRALLAGVMGGLVLLLGGAVGLAVFFAKRETPTASQPAVDPKSGDTASETPGPIHVSSEDPPSSPQQPDPTEPIATRSALSAPEQEKVDKSVERGVDYLKSHQTPSGSWGEGQHALGQAALPALTLLECGLPANDEVVQKAAAFVRANAPKHTWTYDIALSVLFLDRLGDRNDEPLIHTLGLRLVAGQTTTGGWKYRCPVLSSLNETKLLVVLEQTRPRNPLELFVTGNDGKANLGLIGLDKNAFSSSQATTKLDADGPFRGVVDGVSKLRPDDASPSADKRKTEAARKALTELPKALQQIPSLQPPSSLKEMPASDGSGTDNSNTQFAILGVLAVSQHGVPTERAMGLIVQRFRVSQNGDGTFGYHYIRGSHSQGSAAMTGAGLLGLAVTHGLTAGIRLEGMAAKGVQDKDIQKAMTALSRNIERPLAKGAAVKSRTPVNLYFLWTVERVGMLYGLPKINDKDWYHWGSQQLVELQDKKGHWSVGGYPGTSATTDTSFGLLFLKRANLAKDLTLKIRSKLDFVVDDK